MYVISFTWHTNLDNSLVSKSRITSHLPLNRMKPCHKNQELNLSVPWSVSHNLSSPAKVYFVYLCPLAPRDVNPTKQKVPIHTHRRSLFTSSSLTVTCSPEGGRVTQLACRRESSERVSWGHRDKTSKTVCSSVSVFQGLRHLIPQVRAADLLRPRVFQLVPQVRPVWRGRHAGDGYLWMLGKFPFFLAPLF